MVKMVDSRFGLCFLCFLLSLTSVVSEKRPNIIFILADDLGYGDLSVAPFSSELMGAVSTPALSSMAASGLRLSHLHSASPVGLPARAALLTGLFPHRLGISHSPSLSSSPSSNFHGYDLPPVPNYAMCLRDAGYYTAHIGQWKFNENTKDISSVENKKESEEDHCKESEVNLFGFDEYVGFKRGQDGGDLKYTKGAKYLFKNNHPLLSSDNSQTLTDKQTDEAIRVINEQTDLEKSFFINLWYDAPHSPFEAIEPFYSENKNNFATEKLAKYASMISNLDMNIGRLLKAVNDSGNYENTFIMFTSDNGPEAGAGSAGKYRGTKRMLSEGGIKVPAIIQWPRNVLSGGINNKYIFGTDIFPTLLDIAKVPMPTHIRIDGLSFLPILKSKVIPDPEISRIGDERIIFYYSQSLDFPKLTSVQLYGYKLLWNDYEGRKGKLPPAFRLYDIRTDDEENRNLLPILQDLCPLYLNKTFPNDSFKFEEIAKLPRLTKRSGSHISMFLLQMVSHLHLLEHIFRFEADYESILYHQNKFQEIEKSCDITRVNSSTFLKFQNPLIQPMFCGNDIHSHNNKNIFSCTCQFNNDNNNEHSCSNIWSEKSGSVLKGIIHSHLFNFGRNDDLYIQNVNHILKSTKYRPLCQHFDYNSLSVEHTHSYINPEIKYNKKSKDYCHYGIVDSSLFINNGWASDSSFKGSHDSNINDIHICYQRIQRRTFGYQSNSVSSVPSVHLAENKCGVDAPVYVLNHKGMHHSINVCPVSMLKMSIDGASFAVTGELHQFYRTSKRGGMNRMPYMDDNAMMAAVNEYVFNHHDKFFSSNDTLAWHDSDDENKKVTIQNSVAVIDALFFHTINNVLTGNNIDNYFLHPDEFKKNSFRENVSDKNSEREKYLLDSVIQSFFQHSIHRIRGESIYQLDLLIIPILFEEVWSLVVLFGDFPKNQKKSSTKKKRVFNFIHYDPANDELKKGPLVEKIIQLTLNTLLNDEVDVLNVQMTDFGRNIDLSEDKSIIEIKSMSGAKVILYLRQLLKEYSVLF